MKHRGIDIYIPQIVRDIQSYYGHVLSFRSYDSVRSQLFAIADKLYQGVSDKVMCMHTELNNYNPKFIGISNQELSDRNDITIDDCRTTIALEYGFTSWNEVEHMQGVVHDVNFESAVDFLLCGKHEELEEILLANPHLTSATSDYGHNATILHYAGSNGVELYRQQVPLDLAKGIELLVGRGADPNAKMNVYSGEFTVLELLRTSAHPYKTGIAKELIKLME